MLTLLIACDDEKDVSTNGEATTDQGTEMEESPVECPLMCSDHGTCVIRSGLPDCDCDEGYISQGFECIGPAAQYEVTESFTCPMPGELSGPQAIELVTSRWYLHNNGRACTEGSKDIYHFRPDGVFSRRHQSLGAMVSGGTRVYGCWSVTESSSDLTLEFDHAEEGEWTLNCGFISGLDDPPCSGGLKWSEADDAFILLDPFEHGDRILLRRVGESCEWCRDDGCCPDFGYVGSNGQAFCE